MIILHEISTAGMAGHVCDLISRGLLSNFDGFELAVNELKFAIETRRVADAGEFGISRVVERQAGF